MSMLKIEVVREDAKRWFLSVDGGEEFPVTKSSKAGLMGHIAYFVDVFTSEVSETDDDKVGSWQ